MGRRWLVLTIALATALAGRDSAADESPAGKLSGRLLIMAAASTTDAVEQIRAEFIRQHPAVTVRASYGASSTLARQIEAGAGADLFLSANTEWADFLVQRKLVATKCDLLGNSLVIVVPADSSLAIKAPEDLATADIRHLALADAQSVPAGIYAKQALEKLDLWKSLASRVTGAADVRQALQFVAAGAAEAGIVYATDAASSDQVRVAARFDAQASDPIRYPLVLLEPGAKNAAAVAFYDYLRSPAAAAVFRKFGFAVLEPRNKSSE